MHTDLSSITFTHRPANAEELFNLRHAQARNIIERVFGIFKRRFAVARTAPEYSIGFQSKLIAGLVALHGFIQVHDPDDLGGEYEEEGEEESDDPPSQPSPSQLQESVSVEISAAERAEAENRRNIIAQTMWADYQVELMASEW